MSAASFDSALAWAGEAAPRGAVLRLDSRRVEKGDVFVAVPGFRSDGRSYIAAAVKNGASAVLLEELKAGERAEIPEGVPALEVSGLARNLGRFASGFAGIAGRR